MRSPATALIVGGSSGLGLELARFFRMGHDTFITGREDPQEEGLTFHSLELNSDTLGEKLDVLIEELPHIDVFVYAAGFFQPGAMAMLNDGDIEEMGRVGLLAPAMILHRLLKKQGIVSGFIAITSTSQWTPRRYEPMYTATKAGLGMLAHSVSLDEKVDKVLVVGPAGMRTRFWATSMKTIEEVESMLDPQWVAGEIVRLWTDQYAYRFARILRGPPRTQVVDTQ